ncbi:MAG: polysaccharide deacetylase family protein [Isosphaeraceae bacterium]
MFFHGDIKGNRLPRGILCLTYDDGPGPRTHELCDYLYESEIRAAFFVIGGHAEAHPEVLERLVLRDHLVGNHTTTHPGLVALAQGGGDVVREIAETDRILGETARRPPTYVRAPYGNWRETVAPGGGPDRPTSVVAGLLNRSGLSHDHVGPINWDISGHDHDYWRDGRPAEECAREYLERIERAGSGIVLMHDSSNDPVIRAGNRTFEVTRMIVPRLRAEGYRFVGLDEVPQVQSAARVSRQVALLAEGGGYLGLLADDRVAERGGEIGPGEQFGLVDLGEDRVAVRASQGLFLSHRRESGTLRADARSVGPRETFRRSKLGKGRVALRDPDGQPLRAGGRQERPTRTGAAGRYIEIDLFR